MILIDTSVWIDHLRSGNSTLVRLLNTGQVLAHPFVLGELALGNLRQRQRYSRRSARPLGASDQEVLHFISQHRLFESGIGYVDTHLLAAAQLTAATAFLTRDKRLQVVAERQRLAT